MARLDEVLNAEQIAFLEKEGIADGGKDYSSDEAQDLYFAVMDKLQQNLGDEITAPDEYSKMCSEIMSKLMVF